MTSAGLASGGEALVAALAAHGVEVVFGIPGTHNLPVYDALGRSPIRHVAMRHEQGLGYAADGYARRSGRPGVVLTTTGPAMLNAATAAAQSWSDSVPVLVLSPGMPRRHPAASTGYLHELPDAGAAMRGAMGRSVRVETHAELVREIADAFARFSARRPRPVHVEIPLDLLAERAEVEVPLAPALAPAEAAPDAVEAATELLRGARRVAIVAGGGAVGAARELRALAELLGAGVVTTTNGKGAIDERCEWALGAGVHLDAVRAWLSQARVVVAVGTELAESDFWQELPALEGALVRIDLDPAQAHGNLRSDVALIGDAARALTTLTGALAAHPERVTPDDAYRSAARDAARDEAAAMSAPWAPWLDALRGATPAGTTFVGDSAMACYYGALNGLALTPPERLLYPTGVGTLGYALPAAVGAALAWPAGPVVALSGDGGLMFTVAELAAAAALQLPLPVVTFVNGGYGEIRREMHEAGFPPHGVDFPPPDLPALAAALGAHGVAVAEPAELADAVAAALERPRPTLIAVPETR